MEEIERHKARIYAALDKVSKIISESERQDQDDAKIHQRDADVIEELEAALAEERADVQAERAEVTALKSRLAEVEKRCAEAQAAQNSAQQACATLETRLARASEVPAPQSAPTGPLEATISRLNARIENQDIQFQRLKSATAQLRESIGILRNRNADMLGDPTVIDQALMAELEALKSTRAADVDEMDTILEELKPLVEGQINA